ncbi:YHS domain protein [Leptospira broomii serovar Hurstbridge str. 5399]|uniref:YHS domain protein n=1 Tax=Leptospira broomii serovar Hurstbridge str. 5399 TaxID=1049789 RepID=T0FA78_9LEPT|nr:YHS domain-containing (seleno)protein [Leptospira broomii]EQA44801.1 YHS domain protein [Leptospira broomii serovar Hurstbridge str. 5399]
MNKLYFLFPSLLLFIAACSARQAVDPIFKADGLVAIRGYDPVAYFSENKAVAGNEKFQTTWNGAKWKFSSNKNMEAFKKKPESFAPQYGGYCAYAMRDGETYEIDPNAWKIVDGKLYLNYNEKVNGFWSRDIPGNIKKANDQWIKLPKKKEIP